MYKCLETCIIGKMTDGRKRRPLLKRFVNLVRVTMLSVGVEGHLSRLLPDESLQGGNERKGEGAQPTAKPTI